MRAAPYQFDLTMHVLDKAPSKLHHGVLELRATFGRLLERWGCELSEFNGEPDHVHLLLRMHPP